MLKYNITYVFKNNKDFDDWYYSLNNKQKVNLCNLSVLVNEVEYIKKLIIDINLLICSDYNKRIEALSKLKNVNECSNLLPYICELNFINSKNFYSDIEKVSTAKDPREELCILTDDIFINSPYHISDMKILSNEDNYNNIQNLLLKQ